MSEHAEDLMEREWDSEMSDDVRIDFDDIERETPAAYLIKIDDESIWLPKSEVRVYEKKKAAYVPEWLAIKKGLI